MYQTQKIHIKKTFVFAWSSKRVHVSRSTTIRWLVNLFPKIRSVLAQSNNVIVKPLLPDLLPVLVENVKIKHSPIGKSTSDFAISNRCCPSPRGLIFT